MTINVALVTSEALIMGCDSIASSTRPMIDPFNLDWHKDDDGNLVKDKKGRYLIPIDRSDVERVVSNLYSGVSKMFLIHNEPDVIATTAGAAKLNEKTIKVLAELFCEQHKNAKKKLVNIEPIARAFLRFIRKEFDLHHKDSRLPPEFRDGPEFLLGGYGRDDTFPSLYRVVVATDEVFKEFAQGECGLSWNGQAESIERVIRGYDSELIRSVESCMEDAFDNYHQKMSEATLNIINSLLTKLHAKLPDGIDTSLPARVKAEIPWDELKLMIDYANMPLQNGIDFVSWLCLTQSARAKFARGLPTVGGRIHIGMVTKSDRFRMLGEPELEHRYPGFAHDL